MQNEEWIRKYRNWGPSEDRYRTVNQSYPAANQSYRGAHQISSNNSVKRTVDDYVEYRNKVIVPAAGKIIGQFSFCGRSAASCLSSSS